MSSIPAKDVIYIDVDDEITAIIDKVRASQSKIIALVLPKRATTLQSIVNMKLLKRSADTDKKHLVLITAELGLMPLAANVGFYVAKTLQSKPEIPELPEGMAAPKHDESEEETATLEGQPPCTGPASDDPTPPWPAWEATRAGRRRPAAVRRCGELCLVRADS